MTDGLRVSERIDAAQRSDALAAASGRQMRLAVDIGGTFTDVVIEWPGGRCFGKVLTTRDEPEQGFLEGAQLVL